MKEKTKQTPENNQVMGFIERAKKLLEVGTIGDVLAVLEVKRSTYDSWVSRKSIPDSSIYKVAEKLNVSREWVEGREGASVVEEPLTRYGGGTVPVLSVKVSAGGGNHLESIDSYETRGVLRVDERMFPGGIEGVRALEVEGESMIPVVMPGSWVFCRPVSEWGGDALYVLIFRGILMVKLVTADPATGNLWIRSANPAYESWEYDPTEDQSTMRIVGRVVRVLW